MVGVHPPQLAVMATMAQSAGRGATAPVMGRALVSMAPAPVMR